MLNLFRPLALPTALMAFSLPIVTAMSLYEPVLAYRIPVKAFHTFFWKMVPSYNGCAGFPFNGSEQIKNALSYRGIFMNLLIYE